MIKAQTQISLSRIDDGTTPVKGVDYFTDTEISTIEENASNAAAELVQEDIEIAQNATDVNKTDISSIREIIGAASWANQHGTFELSIDEEVQDGTYYFVYEDNRYQLVDSPSGNPIENSYYVLSGVTESITDFMAAHMEMKNNSLWVYDGSGYKVQIGSAGIKMWKENKELATYSDIVVLGDTSGLHMRLSDGELGFYQGGTKVAYINTNKLFITQAEITDSLKISNFIWKIRDEGRLTLMYSKSN